MSRNPSLAGRVALVAGASRGLGAAAAEALAGAGATVVLVARTQGALETLHDRIQAAGGKAVIAPVDITDGDAVDRLAMGMAERFGKLDVLALTAAMLGVLSPISHVSPAVFENTVATNLVAQWRLIRNFEAMLRRSDAGRAIVVAGGPTTAGRAYWGPYAASKAGLAAMVACWAEETRATPLRVNMIDPGPMATALRREAYPGEAPTAQPSPAAIAPLFVALADPACRRHGETVRPEALQAV